MNFPTGGPSVFGSWSFDSRVFTIGSGPELWEVRIPGGAPERIARPGGPVRGASRSRSGDTIFATVTSRVSLFLLPATGGAPQEIKFAGLPEGNYSWPEFLPGTDDFLVIFDSDGTDGPGIYLATLRDGTPADPVLLMRNRTAPHYTPARGDQLLFAKDNTLYVQRLNLGARRVEGEPESIVSGVSSDESIQSANLSVSMDGVLAWRPGSASAAQVTTFDRAGTRIGSSGSRQQIFGVKLSPDEQHLLIMGSSEQRIVEPDRTGELIVDNVRTAITTLWAPDNQCFLIPEPGRVLERPVSGGEEREILKVPDLNRPEDVSADGTIVLYTRGALASEVFAAFLDGRRPPQPVLQTGEQVYNTRFSPDARWIVYEAYAPGNAEGALYVQPFPGPGLRRQISASGTFPVWRKDGREIVFVNRNTNEV